MPVAAEPPPKVQTVIDFDAPAAPTVRTATHPQQPPPSRYAAPMPIDDGFTMPAVNWRIIALGTAAVVIVILAILGVRALYRVTMTAPADETETTEVSTPTPTPTSSPTQTPTPPATTPATATTHSAKATVDRKPLPLKPFYIDSDHSTEQEKK